ncbi:MAG: DUF4292 domain-containing protein [Crocinitomicaceae bacterium]
MIQCTKYGVWILSILLLTSCANHYQSEAQRLEKVKDIKITTILDSLSSMEFSHFYTKLSTKYKDSSQNVSFKTSIRITRDSAVNTLVTFARFPVLNALFTKDSVKVTDKQKKCYSKKSLSYLKESFDLDFSFSNVEELLVGMPVGFDNEKKYSRVDDSYNYTMSSHSKREIKKNEKKGEREIITYYTLTDDLKQLKQIVIESPLDTTFVKLEYKSYEIVDTYVIPYEVEVTIESPSKSIFIELEYKKTRLNEPEPIYFTIPEGYDQCK